MPTEPKRYAQVGLGGRSAMFSDALSGSYRQQARIVALCDKNPGRVQLRRTQLSEKGLEVPGYGADQFDQLLAETRPDTVIVTTRDCDHDDYMCRAMENGCDVITEKPMTTDAEKCRRILDVQQRTGRRCRVSFNYRYSPPRTQLKELLMSGVIGEILSVDFHWLLNTGHGADYFRRWHRRKANSGGLLVHKATHHFDLINWWLSSVPETVYAQGARRFYTPKTAERMGLTRRTERCLDCPEAECCPFRLDLRSSPNLKALYLDQEHHDGYFRDRCVFSDDMDIEDSLHLNVSYRSGALMSYSLHAFMPWEGHVVVFNGSRGRIEHKCEETTYINGDGATPGALMPEGTWTRVYPIFQPPYSAEIRKGEGGHGGGDPVLLADLFDATPPADPFLRAADQRAGAWSILTGVAGNCSLAENRPVRIDSLVPGLAAPDYPPMPSGDDPIDPRPMMKAMNALRRRKEG